MMIKKINDSQENAGFTLIEVIISITILSFLMASMYQIVNTSTDTKDRVLSEDRDSMQVLSALHRIDLDLSQIYSPLYHSAKYSKKKVAPDYDFDQQRNNRDGRASFKANERFIAISNKAHLVPVIDNPSNSEISFMTSSNRRFMEDSKVSRFSWVRYKLESLKSEDNERYTIAPYALKRSVDATNVYYPSFRWESIKSHTLIKYVKSFQIQFWHPKRGRFLDSITELNEYKDAIRAFKVIITWIDRDKNEQTVSRVFRPLQPYFDTTADEKIREAALKGKQNQNSLNFDMNEK